MFSHSTKRPREDESLNFADHEAKVSTEFTFSQQTFKELRLSHADSQDT
jgi:hypothetical protein